MTPVIDFVRLTIKEGAKDRFLTCQTFEPPPEKPHMGRLFVLVEITKKWLSAAQIGQRIVGQFGRSYYQSNSTSDLENFEKSVTQVNTLLSSTASLGESDWIGNLHCALILVNESNLHAATVGDMAVWLSRAGRFSFVTEPTEPDEVNPPKVFGSVVSGTLQPADRLFVGSSLILDTLSKSQIHQALSQKVFFESGLTIARSMKSHRNQEAAGLLIESAASNQTEAADHPSVIYLDQPLQTIQHRLIKAIKETPAMIKSNISPITRHISSQSIDKARRHIQVIQNNLQSKLINQTTRLTRQIVSQIKKILPIREKIKTDAVGQTLIGKTIFTIHDYQPASVINYRSHSKILSAAKSGLRSMANILRLGVPKKFRQISWPLLGALGLLLILVISTTWQKKQSFDRQHREQTNQQLKQANQHLEDGRSALIFNNRKEAQQSFAQSIELAQSLKGQAVDQAKVDQIITTGQNELDKLIGATRFSDLKAILTFTDIDRLIAYNGRLFMTNSKQPKIAEFNQLNNAPDEFAALSATPFKTQPILSENLTYLVTPTTIEKINLDTQQVTVFTHPDQADFSSTKNMGIFGANLYTLEPAKNRISKYTIQKESLTVAGNYVKNGDVSDGVSMAIDGAVYILKKNGGVLKLSRGEKQDFKLKDIPTPDEIIEQPLQIDTDESIASIFIADAKEPRILEFDKTGKYLHQFILPADNGELRSVFYQLKSRKAWVVLGDGVYEVNL